MSVDALKRNANIPVLQKQKKSFSLLIKKVLFLDISHFSTGSVEPPWERAMALNKVPYYIK